LNTLILSHTNFLSRRTLPSLALLKIPKSILSAAAGHSAAYR